jgi:hypothetical protein
MYSWQTLILAKVARHYKAGSHPVLPRVKDVLYAIGQPFFVDCKISCYDDSVWLKWSCEGRSLTVIVPHQPRAEITHKLGEGEPVPLSRDSVPALADWLILETPVPRR